MTTPDATGQTPPALLPIPARRLVPVPLAPPRAAGTGGSGGAPPYRLGRDLDSGETVALTEDERRKHYAVIGASGTGKSFLLLNMLLQDIADTGCGAALLDPHGSLYDLVVHRLAHEAPELAERVVLFDPNATDRVTGFNPLGDYARSSPAFAVSMMTAACLKAWGQPSPDQTPRIARWLPNLLMPIVANGLTLVETAWLLNTRRDNPYRRLLLRAVKDEFIVDDWREFEEATGTQRTQLLEGVQNRLRKFLANDRLRGIFGQQQRVLSVERLLAGNKVLLVNLRPSEQIDEESMRLIGILLLNEFHRVARLREPEPTGRPDPFYVYVDECYSFVTRDLARSLDGTRKYGLYFRLAHQTFEQLRAEDEQLLASVLTNCRGKVVFGGVHPDDADLLVRQLYTDPDMTLQVKHEHRQTKFRPVEAPNLTYTFAEGEQESKSRVETTGTGQSVADGAAHAASRQTTTSRSEGSTRQAGNTVTTGNGLALARQQGENESAALSRGTSTGENVQTGETVTAGSSDSAGDSLHRQTGRSEHLPAPPGALPRRTLSASEGTGHTTGHTDSQSDAHNRSVGHQRSEQASATASQGTSRSTTVTGSANRSQAASESTGRQQSVTAGESAGETATRSQTVTRSEQQAFAEGTTSGTNASRSVAVGIRHRMEEFTESTPVPWSLPEVRHRQACRLMDQGQAVATLRVGNGPVRHTRIDHVALPPIDPEFTRLHWALFREDVIDSAPEYYLTPEEAQQEIAERQRRIGAGVLEAERPDNSRPGASSRGPRPRRPQRPAVQTPTAGDVSAGEHSPPPAPAGGAAQPADAGFPEDSAPPSPFNA
jgi:hypothetical protein